MPIYTSIESSDELQSILKNNKGIVILKFTADWCQPCRRIASIADPWVETLAKIENVSVYVLNVDNNVDIYGFLRSRRQLSGIPAILLYKEGNTTWAADDQVLGSNSGQVNDFFNRVKTHMIASYSSF